MTVDVDDNVTRLVVIGVDPNAGTELAEASLSTLDVHMWTDMYVAGTC